MTDKLDDAAIEAIRARHEYMESGKDTPRGMALCSPVQASLHADRATLLAALDAERAKVARLREALGEAYRVLARAHDRIHCLPRTSDTELAEALGKSRAEIFAALKETAP